MPTDWTDREALVTGGAGFIGSFLVEALVDRGANVVVADNFSRGGPERIEHLQDKIELLPTDLTTHKGCVEADDGDSIELFGDGSQQRGFIYVTDLVERMLRAMDRKTDGEPINLGNGKEVVSINELAETIIEISGKDLDIEHDLSKPTGTDKYAADTTKMEAELEWTPSITLQEDVREVYEYARSELNEKTEAVAADGGER